jgi:adenine-specific DNA-methyltransferase
MRSLKKESMNLIVTSPPYNIGKAYERKASLDVYVEQQAAAVAEAVRLLHPDGSIITARYSRSILFFTISSSSMA